MKTSMPCSASAGSGPSSAADQLVTSYSPLNAAAISAALVKPPASGSPSSSMKMNTRLPGVAASSCPGSPAATVSS